MKVLVTGDRGYIGSVLVPLLLNKGYTVVGYDTAFFVNKHYHIPHSQYTQITKDIRQIDRKDLTGIDAIIHLSALSNDPMGDLNAALTDEINTQASIRLATLAKEVGITRFLFSSSCSIYGRAENDIVDEKSPAVPLTTYAKSKRTVEDILQKMSSDTFTVGLLRNATVFGYAPLFRNDLVVNNLVCTALAYKQIRVMSDGTPWRPLIDVRDLSKIFILFLEADSTKINREIFNVGFNENNFQVKDIVNEVHHQIPDCTIVYTGEHGNDSRSYQVNFNKLHTRFPNIISDWPLAKSITDMIEQLKKLPFTKDDMDKGTFVRLQLLKNLLSKGIVNDKLFFVQRT